MRHICESHKGFSKAKNKYSRDLTGLITYLTNPMNKKQKQIFEAFEGKLVGGKIMKKAVIEVVSLMPEEIVNYVTSNCWFVSSFPDAYAFTFTGNDLKDQHLIFLTDELFFQNLKAIHYTIVHEIGHVILGHRNSVTVVQTKDEIRKQEKVADKFARKYTSV